jgi:Fe-S cluster assembly protein SufB
VIFCSISEAMQEHPELVKKYLGSVVPVTDNYFATLNSAVFSDGSFVYVPPGVRCPMELSTYFRINAENTGQFERTLIIADKGSYVSYLEGCTAPQRDTIQLHAAVVELVARKTPRSSTPPCRTGIRATRTARAASTTSSPSAPIAGATGPR